MIIPTGVITTTPIVSVLITIIVVVVEFGLEIIINIK